MSRTRTGLILRKPEGMLCLEMLSGRFLIQENSELLKGPSLVGWAKRSSDKN